MLVGHRQHGRGGIALAHLARDVRAGQDACGMARQHLLDDLRHPHIGALLEPLDQRHHWHPGPQFLAQFGPHAAEPVRGHAHHVRGHAHHQNVGAVGGLGEIVGGAQGLAEDHVVAQVPRIAVMLVDVVGGLLRAHPLQRRTSACAVRRHGGSPGTTAKDNDFGFAHLGCHEAQRIAETSHLVAVHSECA